jgi:hypothetical protein
VKTDQAAVDRALRRPVHFYRHGLSIVWQQNRWVVLRCAEPPWSPADFKVVAEFPYKADALQWVRDTYGVRSDNSPVRK